MLIITCRQGHGRDINVSYFIALVSICYLRNSALLVHGWAFGFNSTLMSHNDEFMTFHQVSSSSHSNTKSSGSSVQHTITQH